MCYKVQVPFRGKSKLELSFLAPTEEAAARFKRTSSGPKVSETSLLPGFPSTDLTSQ